MQSADGWTAVKKSALAAFGARINQDAPGLVEVASDSGRYANVDQSARQIVIDIRAFVLSLITIGAASRSRGNAGTWLVDWLRKRAPSSVFGQAHLLVTAGVQEAVENKFEVVISRSLQAVLSQAADHARTTVRRTLPDLRHVAAVILGQDGAGWAQIAALGWSPRPADRADFCKELLRRIGTNPETHENMEAWERILLRKSRTVDVSGFSSDTPPLAIAGDPLDIDTDVRAFARLICLEEASPPLSIGLFGGWGSGKSTFMQRLELEIGKLCAKETARRERMIDLAIKDAGLANSEQTRFISNAIQIRFNAWHFADANLWASLTAEFFDQLRSGGFTRQGTELHARLVEKVNAYIHSLSASLAASKASLAEGEKKLERAQKARDDAVLAAESADEVMSQTLVDAVSAAYEKHKGDLVELGKSPGMDDPAKGIAEFVEVAKQVRGIGGQIFAVGRVVFARGWRTTLLIVGVAVVGGALSFIDIRSVAGLAGAIAGAAGVAAALAPAIRIVGGIVKTTARFAKDLDKVSAQRIKEVIAKEAELKAALDEAQARRDAVSRATQALGRYVDPKGVANPPRLLRYVLEDDPDTKALEKEIGIISRARRLFQAVDEIVKKARATRAAVGSVDTEVPDRIILYIDDLDRCTHSQVYAVMQAIHLLLAFELFVVVVGVDVNWIQESLEAEIDGFHAAPRSTTDGGRKDIDLDRRKRAIDYLEKIFQLPFWLQPLDVEGGSGGTYSKYVRSLLAPDPSQNRATGSNGFGNSLPTDDSDASKAALQAGLGGPEAPVGVGAATSDQALGLEEALSTVQLTPGEVDCLAATEIGRLAARDPRAVKRLINVYRIVRARMNADQIDRLLGRGGRPTYPLLVLLAAIETGQPLKVVEKFYTELRSLLTLDPNPKPSRSDAAGSVPAGVSGPLLPKTFALCPDLADAFALVSARMGGAIAAAECLELSRDLRRFSFNRIQ